MSQTLCHPAACNFARKSRSFRRIRRSGHAAEFAGLGIICPVLCAAHRTGKAENRREISVKNSGPSLATGSATRSPHGAWLAEYLDLNLAGYRHQHDRSHRQRHPRRCRAAARSKPGSRREFAFRDFVGGHFRPGHAFGRRGRYASIFRCGSPWFVAERSSRANRKARGSRIRKIERRRSCGGGCPGGPVEYDCYPSALLASGS